MTLTFEQKLQNLAELAVKIGLNLQSGQRLLVRAPLESASLVRQVAASAYKAGARLVDVHWNDDALTLARFQDAPRDSFDEYPAWRTNALKQAVERGDALLSILATDPDLLKDQDPELVAQAQRIHDTHMLPARKLLMNNFTNWSIISQPIPSWAAKMFPADPPETQMARLWDLIFRVCRVDQPDPVAAWEQHIKQLTVIRDYLNAKQYGALRYTAPGTDFTVGLPHNHLWNSISGSTLAGQRFVANIPTEEVFTAPHKDKADGVVSSTTPLSHAGVLIEDFTLTFKAGRITNVTAKKGERVLKRLINSDEGAAKLGEVALVPHSSPISQAGVLFYNTLFDENSASHLALGRAYKFCFKDGSKMSDEEFAVAGGNSSLIHVDFMIGSNKMDVDGICVDGSAQPLMRAGEWVV